MSISQKIPGFLHSLFRGNERNMRSSLLKTWTAEVHILGAPRRQQRLTLRGLCGTVH
jgi:hypothetical protein